MIGRRRWSGTVAVGALLAVGTLLVRRSLLEVRGPSMRPTLRAGDLVLTLPLPPVRGAGPVHGAAWAARRRLTPPGTVVVLRDPADHSHRIVKRVVATTPLGVDVAGDDPGWSVDSRVFGTVPHRDVHRLVVARIVGSVPRRLPPPAGTTTTG